MMYRKQISPYIREGSGLKLVLFGGVSQFTKISPYIREGSGLKPFLSKKIVSRAQISPYIREGSGLKHARAGRAGRARYYLPLHP